MKRILAFLLMLITLDASAQTINRKAVYTKGQEFLMTASNRTETTYNFVGQKRELVNQMDLYFLTTVTEVSDSGYLLTNTLIRRQLYVKAMGNEQNLDSDSSHHLDNVIFGKALIEGIGEKSWVLVDKLGDAVNLEDSVSLKEVVARQPKHRFDMTPPLPEKPLRLGEEWTDSSNTDGYKGMITFKLVSLEKGVAKVDHSGKTSKEVKGNNNGIMMYMKTEGISTGSYAFDIRTGILKTNSITTESAGTMEAGGQSIPVNIKMVSSLTVNPKKP